MRKIFITILGIITLWTPLKAQNNSRYYYAGDKVIIHNDFEAKQCGDTTTTKTYVVEYGYRANNNGKMKRKLVMEESQHEEPASTTKFIHNGQLYIKHQGKIYNAKGEVIQ